MIEQSCTSWLADLASSKPAPGGGGAAALVGAVAVSLGAMVGSLTIGKKTYIEGTCGPFQRTVSKASIHGER